MHSCFGFLCICAPRVPRMCLVCAMCVPCAYKVQKWQVWERLWATVWVQGTTSSHPKVLMNICSFHKSRSTLRLGNRLFLIVTECFGVFLGIIFLLFKIYFGFYTCVCVHVHTPKPMCTLHVCRGTHVDVRGQLLGVGFFPLWRSGGWTWGQAIFNSPFSVLFCYVFVILGSNQGLQDAEEVLYLWATLPTLVDFLYGICP